MNPLISILIPYYNDGLYIDEAVESMLSQTYKNIEIIIVNDGSTDEFSIQKIINYTKEKTKVIHQNNKGGGAARNMAFAHANGEYVLTLDADDKFENTFIEKALLILEKDEKIAAVSSWVVCFGEENYEWKLKGGVLKDFIEKNQTVCCALIRRNIWEKVNGFREELKNIYEDWDFWLRVTKLGFRVEVMHEFLFFYRRKKQSSITIIYQNEEKNYRFLMSFHRDLLSDIAIDILKEKNKMIEALKNSKQYKYGKRLLRVINFFNFFSKKVK